MNLTAQDLHLRLNIFKSRMKTFVTDLRKNAEGRSKWTSKYYLTIAAELEETIERAEREIARLHYVRVDE